jgi:hypothetical protein
MDVRLKSLGCMGQIGTVLSLGLLPLLLRSQQAQYPATLSADAMMLRNGTTIPWRAFTRFKPTDVYVNGIYMNTLYELWHTDGRRVHFSSHQVQDADAVVKFIVSHLPPAATQK